MNIKKIFSCLLSVSIIFISLKAQAQDFWKLEKMPIGRGFASIVVDNKNNIYIGSGVGIFKSSDNGKSWQHLGPNNSYIYNILISKENTIFASTPYDGLFRSNDNGKSWYPFNDGLLNKQIKDIKTNSHGDIFLLTATGVYVLKNDKWFQNNNILTNAFTNSLYINSKDELFVAVIGGLFYSDDNSQSWKPLISGKLSAYLIREDKNKDLLVDIYSTDENVYVSKDSGKSWSLSKNNVSPDSRIFIREIIDEAQFITNKKSYRIVTENASESDYNQKLYITEDNGKTLKKFSLPSLVVYNSLKSFNDGLLLENLYPYYSHLYSHLKIENKISKINIENDILENITNQLSQRNTRDKFFYNYYKNNIPIIKNIDNKYSLLPYSNFAIDKDRNIYALKERNLYITTDYAKTWKKINTNFYNKKFFLNSEGHIFTFVEHYNSSYGNFPVYYSKNKGKTWQKIFQPSDCNYVTDFTLDSKNNFFLSCGNTVMSSENSGKSWKKLNNGLNMEENEITKIKITQEDDIFISTTKGFFKFLKTRNRWEEINSGLYSTDIMTFDIDKDGYIYLGTLAGVFRSSLPVQSL